MHTKIKLVIVLLAYFRCYRLLFYGFIFLPQTSSTFVLLVSRNFSETQREKASIALRIGSL